MEDKLDQYAYVLETNKKIQWSKMPNIMRANYVGNINGIALIGNWLNPTMYERSSDYPSTFHAVRATKLISIYEMDTGIFKKYELY